MHSFDELISRGAYFMVGAISSEESRTLERLETGAATSDVKALQMLQLQKAVVAVGLFSILEAHLQEDSDTGHAFAEVTERLREKGEVKLGDEFKVLNHAINALKHGRGRSYSALLKIPVDELPFRVKRVDENFFNEGDVNEVETLVEVDEKFLMYCSEIVTRIAQILG
jgi:hypothetical protein